MSKELTNKEEQDLAVFEVEGSTGFEETTSDSYSMPRMVILQQLSPELNKANAKYIEGAEMGNFFNKGTQESLSELNVIPLKVKHELFVWQPNRGGLVGIHPKTDERKLVVSKDGYKKFDLDGNEIVDTLSIYFMDVEDPTNIFVFPMSSTLFKYGQQFTTRLKALKANNKPVNRIWAGVWNIKTILETKGQNSWYTIGATPKFERFVTVEERDSYILPAIEMLQDAIIEHEDEVVESEAPRY